MAAEVAPGLAEGAWWVELAALADPGLVPATVARTLGLRESPNEPAEAQLLRHLRTGRYLLVLDNCEHLLRACAELAVRLLPACPGLQCLCTSREPLGLTGEISWPLPRLAVSGDKARLEAVQLFVERAAAARLAGARRAGQPARHPGDAAAGHPALQRGRGDGPGAGRRLTWIGRLSRRRGEFNYAEWEIILEPRSSATHLRQRFHYHPQTAVAREMLRALGDSQGIAAACAVSLQKLKRRLEARAANGLPQPA